MTVIDEYLEKQREPEKELIEHMDGLVRQQVPEATEELCYAMPSFKYKDKGLVAVMVNKDFLSLYPFCAVEKLGVDTSGFECTSGSIHFSVDKPIPDKLLCQIIAARIQQISSAKR